LLYLQLLPRVAREYVTRLPHELLVFQSMLLGSAETLRVEDDYPITEREVFLDSRFPCMYFLENRYAGDPTNWWVPNRAGMEAMLRSAGLRIDARVGSEVYYCSPAGR